MLAVVLVVQHQLDRGRAGARTGGARPRPRRRRRRRSRPRRDRRGRGRRRSASRARRSAPAGRRRRRRASSRRRASRRAGAPRPGRSPCAASAASSARTRAASGFSSSGSSSAATARTALVEQLDLGREGVAEEARDAQGDVDPRPVEQAERQDLEAGDPVRGAVPERPRADQGQRLGDVVAAGAHVGGAPGRQRQRARPVAVLLDVALDQQRGRFPAQMPGRRASAPRGCRPNRSCARSAARRAARGSARRDGPGATKRPSRRRQHGRDLGPAARRRTAGRTWRSIASSTARVARQPARARARRRPASRASSSRRSTVSPAVRQG